MLREEAKELAEETVFSWYREVEEAKWRDRDIPVNLLGPEQITEREKREGEGTP